MPKNITNIVTLLMILVGLAIIVIAIAGTVQAFREPHTKKGIAVNCIISFIVACCGIYFILCTIYGVYRV